MQLDDQRKAEAAIQQAERMLKAGQTDPARDVLRRAQKDLPGNAAVAAQLKALDERLEGERAGRERAQLAQSAFRKPVTLQFRDANLKMVFEALSRTANVNIILDRDVKSDLKTTIFVKDASVEDTIDLILLQNQLEKRVLNAEHAVRLPGHGGQAEGIQRAEGAQLPAQQRRREARGQHASRRCSRPRTSSPTSAPTRW